MPFSIHTMTWSGERWYFVVEEFIENGVSSILTQRAFRFALGRRDSVPDKKIHNWVSNFRQTGSTLKRKSSVRPRTKTGPEYVAAVRTSIEQSARIHADALWLSDGSVRRILHRDLKMHSYKVRLHNNWVKEIVKPVQLCAKNSFRTFPVQLFRCLRTRHISTFQAQSTNKISSTGLTLTLGNFTNGHSTALKLLCGVPFLSLVWWVRTFFEEDDVTVTVTSDRYCAMLENFLRTKLYDLINEHGAENVWFQQDCATAHTSRRSLGILREIFPGRRIRQIWRRTIFFSGVISKTRYTNIVLKFWKLLRRR
jgi:hypothetical protein